MKQLRYTIFLLALTSCTAWAGEGSTPDREGRIPRPLWPPDTSRGIGVRPHFLWSGLEGGLRYSLLVSADSLFSKVVYADTSIADTAASLPSALLNDTTYYWQVSARDSFGWNLPSLPVRFSTAPKPVCSPRWLKFPYTRRGETILATLSVMNSADRQLTIDSVSSASGSFGIIDTLPVSLAPGDSLRLSVRFTPFAPAYYSEYLTLVTDLGDPAVFLTGDSPPPLLAASPASVRFGSLPAGDSLNAVLTLANLGRFNDLLLTRFTTAGTAFQVPRHVPHIIAPGESILVQLRFQPPRGSYGWFTDTLRIESDGGSSAIPLSGECPYPEARIPERSITFGDVCYTDSATAYVRVVNSSINTLRIDSVAAKRGPFRARLSPVVILPGDSLMIPVRFVPWRLGTFADTLSLFTNARDRRIRVPLRGASPYPSIGTTPRILDFGETLRGEKSTRELGIYNSSVNPLSVDSLVIRNSAFRIERLSVSDVIRYGDTLRFAIQFAPEAGGKYLDTLLIWSNAGIRQWRVPLTGFCIMPDSESTGADQFALYQNYPNPFRVTTTFRFALPEACYVRLAVYNSLGQELALIEDGEAEAGYHNVKWNSDVASGVYFYKLVAIPVRSSDQQYVGSRRLMVLR